MTDLITYLQSFGWRQEVAATLITAEATPTVTAAPTEAATLTAVAVTAWADTQAAADIPATTLPIACAKSWKKRRTNRPASPSSA